MARHEVVIHENTGALRGTAPYIGSYISKEQVVLAGFAEAVGAKCGLPPIQVVAIIGGAFEAISALECDALVRVHTDLGVVCGVITGSFPTADAAFDPARNALELALRLDDTLRLDLSDTVPVIVTDANLTKLRVDNVMDLAEQKPMNLIHGKHAFRVAGFNMVLSDEGAAAFLQNGLGTTFPLVIDRVVTHQLFEAHTAELLPAGDYKMVVKSRAGDGSGPLQTSFRKVKYLRVEDPGPAPAVARGYSEGHYDPETGDGEGWAYPDAAFVLKGANLAGASVRLGYAKGDGSPGGYAVDGVHVTAAEGSVTIAAAGLGAMFGETAPGTVATITVTTAGGTAAYEAEIMAPV